MYLPAQPTPASSHLYLQGFSVSPTDEHMQLVPAPIRSGAKVALDFSLIYSILTSVDYCVWIAGACLPGAEPKGSRFSFLGSHFRTCKSKTTKIAPFKINHLQNANFISLFF